MLTVGSLFSGIGGLDLGLERAGMTVRWQAEINPYASKVLAHHWPGVPNLGDVTKIDWENDGLDHGDGIARSLHVDLVCGGFPCQPVSLAGRRLAQLDSRWLWPEFARCVRLLRPGHVLVENVPGLLVRGMGDVLGDLATLGYDCEWTGIPAAALGAPHLRWRIFILAHAVGDGLREQSVAQLGCSRATVARADGEAGDVAHADLSGRLERRGTVAVREEQPAPERRSEVGYTRCEPTWGQGQPERPPGHLGGSSWWAVEPDVGRVAHGIPSRVDRLRCLGNAVVPQVAEYVGRQLMAHVGSDG